MEIPFSRGNQSVHKFLRYLLLRHQNGYEQMDRIPPNELWKQYKTFCMQNGENFFNQKVFGRELTRKGILSDLMWVKDKKKLERVRLLDVESVEAALSVWVDNSITHADIMEIDGVKYRIIVKLEKLDGGDNPPNSNEE